jgi:hypothetical protein
MNFFFNFSISLTFKLIKIGIFVNPEKIDIYRRINDDFWFLCPKIATITKIGIKFKKIEWSISN